jgi:glutaminase
MPLSPERLPALLQAIHDECQPNDGEGQVVDYIPLLAAADPSRFGLALVTVDGTAHVVGDTAQAFSIQSASKVLTLALLALHNQGDALWARVGREPSGNRFNSLLQLEVEHGMPRNPFINAGALVMADMLLGVLTNPKEDILHFVRRLAGNENIEYDTSIVASEAGVGFTNAALVNYLKSFGNIKHPVDEVLDLYYHHCALMMDTQDLARAFLLFARQGRWPGSEEQAITPRQVKRINALMATCGFYDQAGEFAFRVGLPGKSGISGCIAAVHPGHYSVAVWSPALNTHGNSVRGMRALDLLTTKLGLSIF